MVLQELHIAGYRSIASLHLDLGPVNIITGHNGCGKSNFYRSLYLLAQAAHGQLSKTFAEEGGLPSALWAGEYKRAQAQPLMLGFRSENFNYELQIGLPIPDETSEFNRDPLVKEECVWYGDKPRKGNTYVTRKLNNVWAMNIDGELIAYPSTLSQSESVIAQLQEPHLYPELSTLHQHVRHWRFYHHFSTESSALCRAPQVGIRTPVLHHDGRDLAAALRTIMEVGNPDHLDAVIDRAFPGAKLQIAVDNKSRFEVLLNMPGMYRPLEAKELSDGTLRYLCLVAALLSPRPPSLLALNEPETSLHSDLLPALAELIESASAYSQIIITTHAKELAKLLSEKTKQPITELTMTEKGTQVVRASKNLLF